MSRKYGIGSTLASLRTLLANPMVRGLFYFMSRDIVCYYEQKDIVVPLKRSILYHAMSLYVGENILCPLIVRFATILLKIIFKVSAYVLKGEEDAAVKALKDPAIRRGVALLLKSIGYYGVTTPQRILSPFLIVWNFTNLCNLRCKHCYQSAGNVLRNELSLHEKLKLIDELDRAGVAMIALSGGEPTIHPDFLPVLKAISSRGIFVAVATNGWRLADINFFRKTIKCGLRYVEVSVDSANPLHHDEFRGVRGSWERAVKALENAVKLGISHAMAVTICKYNIDEIDDILDLAQSIGVRRVVFFNFIPVGNAKEIIDMDLDPFEREKVMRKLYLESKRRGLEIETTAPQYARVVLQMSGAREIAPTHFYVRDPMVLSLAEFIGGCGAGRIYGAINPDGTIIPCVFMPIYLGSFRREGFIRTWTKHPLLKLLRDRDNLKGACRDCPFRNVCGGCRARAYAYFGDPLAPDPGCIRNYDAWRKIAM